MAKVLAVDHGLARTGLAVSDPSGLIPRPLSVIEERDQDRLVHRVADVAQSEGVTEVVVGVPRPLAGGENEQMRRATDFAAALERALSVPVKTWDERFTTKLARQGPGRRRRNERVDARAAAHLLQNYLDARDTRGSD